MALCDLMKHLLLGGIYFLCGSLDSCTPEDSHRTWKWWFGRWLPFSRCILRFHVHLPGCMIIIPSQSHPSNHWLRDVQQKRQNLTLLILILILITCFRHSWVLLHVHGHGWLDEYKSKTRLHTTCQCAKVQKYIGHSLHCSHVLQTSVSVSTSFKSIRWASLLRLSMRDAVSVVLWLSPTFIGSKL